MAVAFFDAAFGLGFFAGRYAPRTQGIPAAGVGNGVFRFGIFEFGIAGRFIGLVRQLKVIEQACSLLPLSSCSGMIENS
jgi:hypothetical protein